MVLTEELETKQTVEQAGFLEMKNLRKVYGDFVAIDQINLNIKEGEFLTLLGGSGSGKTTTLLSVAGFLEPSEGEILLLGESILEKPAHKRNMGMVFQHYSLFPHMSIFENIAFPLKMRKMPKEELNEKVMNIVKLVELEAFIDRKPDQLSGGQQQRVALARALVFEPNILLMDEPLAALDKKLREQMQFELMDIHEKLGLTIIYVTHDQEEALTMSDRIVILNNGKIEQIDTARNIYEKPKSLFVASFIGDTNILKATVTDLTDTRSSLALGGDIVHIPYVDYLTLDEEVHLSVRPEHINYDTDASDQPGELKVTIIEIIYSGSVTKIITEMEDKQQLSIQSTNGSTLQVGDTLYASWNQTYGTIHQDNKEAVLT